MPDLDLFGVAPVVVGRKNNARRPRVPLRIMISLLYLKHAFNGFLERIFSTVQTCAQQGRQTFSYLEEAVRAWLAQEPTPSLVPEHVRARQAVPA
jgi:hypothetical protein